MKHLVLIAIAFFLAVTATAQEYNQSLDGIEWVKIESKQNIIIRAHSKNQLLLKGDPLGDAPERAEGLKLVGAGGSDNTNAGFYVEQEGNTLIVRNLRKTGETEIFLPASQNISVNSEGLNNMEISGFSGEIEANAKVTGNIRIADVTGPVTAHSNTGNVDVVFNTVNQSSPITIATATGHVDVTLPGNTPADLTLQSAMGEIYTNFDLSVPDKDGLKAISSQKVTGSINNGGVKIQLNSATGNIYLRKK